MITGFRIVFHLAFKVGTRQVVQQHLEVGVKQIRPLLPEPDEQILFVRQEPVQASIQPILFGHGEIHAQQLVHRAVDEPLPVDAKLAARRDPPVHHQQPQHFLPRHLFAARRQALLPKVLQAQSPPQLARQPAVAERARPSQFQPAQLHLEATDRALRNLTIVGK